MPTGCGSGPDKAEDEILRRLRERELGARGLFARVQAGPETSAEIFDDPFVRLVILHPRFQHSRRDEASAATMFARKRGPRTAEARRGSTGT